jgi:hypothetical protein
MEKKCLYALVVIFMIIPLFFPQPILAQEINGNTYYIYALDVNEMFLQQFTWEFSDNATESSTDNGTDNAKGSGIIAIEQAGKTFENSSGSYISTGNFYRGSWEATEKNFSNYYEEDIYIYYSFLFYGVNLLNTTYTAGIIYSTTREKTTTKGTEEYLKVLPYIGILVSSSANSQIF